MFLNISRAEGAGLCRTACLTFAAIIATPALAANAIEKAVADPSRLEEHIVRDEGRKPEAILTLSGVAKGDKVADIAAGSGYYTALLSRIVGKKGKVYAIDPALIFDSFPNAKNTFPGYIAKDPRTNVTYSVQRLDELTLAEPVDLVMMGLYYHDTIWTGEDRGAMNKAIYDALVPGGRYVVVDHRAADGAGDEVTNTLHRMEEKVVKPEILDAGFELVAESDVLSNPEDTRELTVFDPAIRGKTDRFVYVFRKPE